MNARTEESFDIVDADDRVIGQAPRSEAHARGLLHRAVHIFVFDSLGRLLLQRRSATKDEYPLRYTSSASGHVSAGETYDTCAPRELLEELGLSAPITWAATFPGGPETANEHSALYFAVTDEPPRLDPSEILDAEFLPLEHIADMAARAPEDFTPPFCTLLRWWMEHRTASVTGAPAL
jgi:16S rRNA (adenine1518-N6/adenine1519-N6)-dimethyltransferase